MIARCYSSFSNMCKKWGVKYVVSWFFVWLEKSIRCTVMGTRKQDKIKKDEHMIELMRKGKITPDDYVMELIRKCKIKNADELFGYKYKSVV